MLEPLRGTSVPPGGWSQTIRKALGRTLRQQANYIGIAEPTLHESERAEAQGAISLRQLRKLAEYLDCELVYALIPRRPLRDVVEARAEELARKEVLGVTHSMSLEDQQPSSEFVNKQIQERRDELLAGNWSTLWR
ncbi:MAG: mobile mystery protein A [Betaproteobacteria bacterium]